jgi:hypothetical protein
MPACIQIVDIFSGPFLKFGRLMYVWPIRDVVKCYKFEPAFLNMEELRTYILPCPVNGIGKREKHEAKLSWLIATPIFPKCEMFW